MNAPYAAAAAPAPAFVQLVALSITGGTSGVRLNPHFPSSPPSTSRSVHSAIPSPNDSVALHLSANQVWHLPSQLFRSISARFGYIVRSSPSWPGVPLPRDFIPCNQRERSSDDYFVDSGFGAQQDDCRGDSEPPARRLCRHPERVSVEWQG